MVLASKRHSLYSRRNRLVNILVSAEGGVQRESCENREDRGADSAWKSSGRLHRGGDIALVLEGCKDMAYLRTLKFSVP